jgi:molecular chaperone GrpE (heat shock protein)
MCDTPDAPPGDVQAGADSGHDETGSDEQNPIGVSRAGTAEDGAAEELPTDVLDQVVAQEIAEAAGDDAATHVLELRAQVAELALSLAASQRRADELATVARKQTEMADELHADNRRLRAGEIREAAAPLVRGLARLADDLSRMRATVPGASEDLAYLDGQVEELLHDAGVFALQAAIGEPFDPQCHQATGSATTADGTLHRTIAEVRRSGLRRDDGRLLRPVDVVVFRYVAPPPPPPPAAQPATEEVT